MPYNGSGPQLQSVVGGQTDVMVDTFNALPMIRSGKLRALAIFSEKRSPTLPDVPTMKEQGIDMVSKGYAALLAPAGTPAAIVQSDFKPKLPSIVALLEVRDQFVRVDYRAGGRDGQRVGHGHRRRHRAVSANVEGHRFQDQPVAPPRSRHTTLDHPRGGSADGHLMDCSWRQLIHPSHQSRRG